MPNVIVRVGDTLVSSTLDLQRALLDREESRVQLLVRRSKGEARVDLACLYRIVSHLGWHKSIIYNHISMRVPGPEVHFLLNPLGLALGAVAGAAVGTWLVRLRDPQPQHREVGRRIS